MTIIDTVLAATTWNDLPGYPRDARGLRRLQRELHPDVKEHGKRLSAKSRRTNVGRDKRGIRFVDERTRNKIPCA